MSTEPRVSTAVAHPNIALAKYWGKLEGGHNLPAVPSLSVTLAGMVTRTRVALAPERTEDELVLGGRPASAAECLRCTRLCDWVWPGGLERAGERGAAPGAAARRPAVRIESENDFPTAAGLASSASAFAALAVAADAAFGAHRSRAELSDIARRVSASAGRSLYGGFVELPAGDAQHPVLPAHEVAPADHWDIAIVVGVTTEARKDVGSTEGMLHTARTSPYYAAWIASAPGVCARVRDAVLRRDIAALGEAAEESALAMHAAAIAARPGVDYWNGVTVELMAAVRALRRAGTPAYFTIDAGPHVKVLCERAAVPRVVATLAAVPGVLRTISAHPGLGARVES